MMSLKNPAVGEVRREDAKLMRYNRRLVDDVPCALRSNAGQYTLEPVSGLMSGTRKHIQHIYARKNNNLSSQPVAHIQQLYSNTTDILHA